MSIRLFDKSIQHNPEISYGDRTTGNALIHGDNVKILGLLEKTYANTVKCAYFDPPYNNGERYRHYIDSMEHHEWIESIRLRLEGTKKLLREDGSVWISIDDSEVHYLKVAADTIFGRHNFVGTIVWERRTTRENRKVFSRNHEYLLVYAKNISVWSKTRNSLSITQDVDKRYKNIDSDPRGPWQSISLTAQGGHATPQQYYSFSSPTGKIHHPPKGRCWIYTKTRMMDEIAKNNIWFGEDGNAAPRLKKFLADRKAGVTPETLWRADEVGTTGKAKKHLLQLFKEISLFDTPKPEELIHRVLEIGTNTGDLVIDPYLGSGTTAAVAHKMGRRYIGIEIGEHSRTHCVWRLRQVIDGENGGVSKLLNWNGGGGFDFYRAIDSD